MLSRLKDAFAREGLDLTQILLTMDAWFVSQPLRERLHRLGFTKIIIAGKVTIPLRLMVQNKMHLRGKKHLCCVMTSGALMSLLVVSKDTVQHLVQ